MEDLRLTCEALDLLGGQPLKQTHVHLVDKENNDNKCENKWCIQHSGQMEYSAKL